MKHFLFFLLLFAFTKNTIAQKDTLIINGIKFLTIKQAVSTNYTPKDTLLKFYRIENGKRIFLLNHFVHRFGADDNNYFEDISTIQIKENKIIFKTHYLQKGNDPIPQWRKRIYKVKDDGKLLLLSDKEFINSKWRNTIKNE